MRRRMRQVHVLVIIVGALAAAALTLLPAVSTQASVQVGSWLIDPLKRRFALHGLEAMETYAGLVVLGGGHARVHEAGRLARDYPHLKLFVSGAGEPDHVMRLLGGGIAPDRVEIDTLPRSTYENAQLAARFLMPAPEQRWLLVTSDFHMPRAVGSFRRAGFLVTPWPVDDLPVDYDQALEIARHEWLGLASYWLLGRSATLFPGPQS